MPRYQYQAQNHEGQLVSGNIQASSRSAALQSLSEHYQLVTELRAIREHRPWFERGPSTEQLLATFQQLAVATSAGVALKPCLETLADDCENSLLQRVLRQVATGLAEGSNMSDAMAQHPSVFPIYQSKLVRAGEASGRLPEVLGQLAEDMESRDALMGQVRSALAYPLFVLSVASILAGLMLAWGVPQIKSIFDAMGADLPLPTQILVNVGMSLSSYWWAWLLGILLAVVGMRRGLKYGPTRARFEAFLLRLYPLNQIFKGLQVALFARTLGLLYRSGVPLAQALTVVAEATPSVHVAALVQTLKERVTLGEMLSSAMRGSEFFPSMACEMVATGESSGALERMLTEIDRFYTRRCEHALRGLTSLLEPALTVLVGLILGGVILGLALPFLNLPALMM